MNFRIKTLGMKSIFKKKYLLIDFSEKNLWSNSNLSNIHLLTHMLVRPNILIILYLSSLTSSLCIGFWSYWISIWYKQLSVSAIMRSNAEVIRHDRSFHVDPRHERSALWSNSQGSAISCIGWAQCEGMNPGFPLTSSLIYSSLYSSYLTLIQYQI